MFPDEVEVLFKAKMSDLKSIDSSDFKVIADFGEVLKKSKKTNTLLLSLKDRPKNILSATLVQNKVEYILEKK